MTRGDLVRALATLHHALDGRVVITRVIVDPDGNEVAHIVRGTLAAPRDGNVSVHRKEEQP